MMIDQKIIDLELELRMADETIDIYRKLVEELRDGLQSIYAMRGEDRFIANICNPLIEKSRP
jgi:hypothetical protein